MPLKIIRQDITKIKCDAIVNPTDPHYSHGGGTDAAIHAAAGKRLYEACIAYGELSIGDAVLTPAFALPSKYVIHTVGPRWYGGKSDEEAALRSCYTACLALALSNGCGSVAFPLIASGTFGFPKDRVLKIATDVIGDFLFDHEMLVYLAVYDKDSYAISEKLFSDIESFIGDNYEDEDMEYCRTMRMEDALPRPMYCPKPRREPEAYSCVPSARPVPSACPAPASAPDLDEMLRNLDCGFADTLFRYIDEKGISDVECYKRANVDKKTFSKIKCNKNYKPSKVTAVSFAIALRLDIEETEHLLKTVGMSLSRSNKFDVIIEYFITTGNYESIFDVNEVLYKFDQVTLGV